MLVLKGVGPSEELPVQKEKSIEPRHLQLGEAPTYRKIPNISSGLIEVRKHILGAYIRGKGLYSEGNLC